TNHHHRKAAVNLFAYVDKILNVETGQETRPQTVEIKWAGTSLPSVRIGPKASRKLDAFWVSHSVPRKVGFNALTDSSEYLLGIDKPGKYVLTYSIVGDNFPQAMQSFCVEFGAELDT